MRLIMTNAGSENLDRHGRLPRARAWRATGSALFLPMLLLSLGGCEVTPEEQSAIESSFHLNDAAPGMPDDVVPAPSCRNDRHTQPPAEITRKLDPLFVLDTSASLDDERAAVANGIDAFVAALPPAVDLRIGVLLAHGGKSAISGRLFRSVGSEPYVLSNDTMSMATIRSYLRDKMTRIKRDNYADGGEEGLYALSRALSDSYLEDSRKQGFFRQDSALAVVMVSDENDICAEFPEGYQPVKDNDGIEPQAKARDCKGVTPVSVSARLRQVQGDRPLLVAAVVYTDNSTFKRGEGENEVGYGWLDLARLTGGVAVDLASGHIEENLSQIGSLATVRMNLVTTFTLENPTNLDAGSIQVKVDGTPVPFSFTPETNQVHLANAAAGGPLSTVDISYCEKRQPLLVSETCRAGAFSPKASVKVGLSIDPAEGTMNTIIRGFQTLGITPAVYTDAEVAAGKPTQDGVTVLAITRKVVLSPVNQAYIDGVRAFVSNGGSLLGEYDGAALFFTSFSGAHSTIPNLTPSLSLFTGSVSGGGALLPLENSRAYVTDAFHPITEGMPSDFLLGVRAAFAVTGHDADWLHTHATFISSGYMNLVPAGTYPAVMSGRCGPSRVALFTMTHFQVIGQEPFKRMMSNTLRWVVGQTN